LKAALFDGSETAQNVEAVRKDFWGRFWDLEF